MSAASSTGGVMIVSMFLGIVETCGQPAPWRLPMQRCFPRELQVSCEQRHRSSTVPALLGGAAVCVVNAIPEISISFCRRLDSEELIKSYAGMTGAPSCN